VWNFAEDSPIERADLDGARLIINDSLARNDFGTRFELATDTEQRSIWLRWRHLVLGPIPLLQSPRHMA
jgi:hypothetical protein